MLDSQSLFFHCQNLYKYCTLALKAFKKFNLILKTRIRLSKIWKHKLKKKITSISNKGENTMQIIVINNFQWYSAIHAGGHRGNCLSNCIFRRLLCFQKWKCQSESKIQLCFAYNDLHGVFTFIRNTGNFLF
jgi:hypothetical protein